MEFIHKPVLFDEAIDALNIKPDGIYFDGTSGGGGHSGAIASRLTSGRLISVDQDPDAIEILHERLGKYPCVTVVKSNFCMIKQVLSEQDVSGVDGILLDLGVSSHQLDEGERGFSYKKDAPLDMRMSQEGTSAADLVNNLSEQELSKIIFTYGEEKFAKRIAAAIVRERKNGKIETTLQLAEIVKNAIPAAMRREGGNPARRTFQALRIEVNGELDKLSKALDEMVECLNPGGRIAVITFHSLEDRIVKQRFAKWCSGCTCPPDFPVCVCGKKPLGLLPFKAKAPTEEELEVNPRSRSARLRVFEKARM